MSIEDIIEEKERVIVGILSVIGVLIICLVILDWDSPGEGIGNFPENYTKYEQYPSSINDKIKKIERVEKEIVEADDRIKEKKDMKLELEQDISNTNSTINNINGMKNYSMILGAIIGFILGIIISFPIVKNYVNKKLKDEGYI